MGLLDDLGKLFLGSSDKGSGATGSALNLIQHAMGKKCPQCGNWTMHNQKPGYWRCSKCDAVVFGDMTDS